MTWLKFCIQFFCLLLSLCLWGQQRGDTILLDMRSGLSECRVRSIAQMPDGRIAIATTTTIDIYDGTRFHAYRLPPEQAYPLPEYQGNRQLTCDTTGLVWLRNKQILYVVDAECGQVVRDVEGLLHERGLTNEDIAQWPTAPEPPTPLTWEGRFSDETVTAYMHDDYGGLWIGTKNYGILYLNPRRSHLFCTNSNQYGHEPCPIFCSPRASRLSSKLAPSGTNCSYEERSRYLYLGTLGGVLVIDQRDSVVATISEQDGLLTNNVSALYADRRGNIWVTTAGGGISCIRVTGHGSFDIVSYGMLDGICTDGREFMNGHLFLDTDGWMTAGFVGGTVVFHPESVLTVKHYAFHVPCRLKKIGEDVERESSAIGSWWIVIALALGIVILCFMIGKGMVRNVKLIKIHSDFRFRLPSEETMDKLKNYGQDESKQDEAFLGKLQQTVERNLSNEDFSVQQLSEQMAMDRTVLYRRMQALSMGSPSAYIKRVRMEVAARLLHETGLPISEIALRTGFPNAKYFSVTFKTFFGQSPSVFRENASQER